MYMLLLIFIFFKSKSLEQNKTDIKEKGHALNIKINELYFKEQYQTKY